MKKVYLLLLTAFSCSYCFSQAWDWSKTSGPNITSVAIDPQQFFITASSNGTGIITKRDRDGNTVWQKAISKPNGTGMYGIVTDASGNIYASSGRFDSINHVYVGHKGSVNKFDFNGNLLWSRTFKWIDGNNFDRGDISSSVITKDEQDNIYITGLVGPTSGLNYQSIDQKIIFENDTISVPDAGSYMVLLKIDKDGNKKWLKAFNYFSIADYIHRTSITSLSVKNNVVALCGTGNVVMITFDATTITTGKGTNFLTTLDATDGHVKWVKNIAFNSFQFACMGGCDAAPARVTFNGQGKIIFGSAFMDTLKFGGVKYVSYAKKQYYICRYDTSGTEEKMKIFPNDYLGNGDITQGIPFYEETSLINTGNSYYYHVLSHLYKLDTAFNINWTSVNSAWYAGQPYAQFNHKAMATDPNGQMLAQVTICGGNTSIAGQETLTAPGSYVSRINTNYNIVSGTVFYDSNGNGIKDAGEKPAKFIPVGVPVSNRFIALSDSAGLYECLVDTGSFIYSPLRVPSYHTITPASYSVSTNSFNQHIINKDFALKPIPNVNDMMVDISSWARFRPGFYGGYKVNIINNGTTSQGGTCVVKLSDKLQYNFSDPAPDITTPDSLVFNYPVIPPGMRLSVNVYFDTKFTAAIGDNIISYAYITPLAADTVPSNNFDTASAFVTGSFDPNDKDVNLAGNVSIDRKTEWLEYTIRFQNTGNDTAFNIRVIDTISSKLDPASFELISSTHPVQPSFNKDKLTFFFDHILLVDSNHNEPLSHGMVKFRMKPVSNIQVNDSITNRASIYFDYNQPVLTNTIKTKYVIGTPTVNLGNDITTCGGPVTLNAGNAGARYVWSTGDTLQSINVNSSGSYWVRVTNSYGFSASDTIQVTINAKPVVNLGNDITQCGGNAVLNAGNAGSSYLWSNGATTQNITVSSTGNYNVKVTNAAGCSANDTVLVTINALPVVNLGSDITQCGGTTTLNAGNSGSSYLWNNNATTASLAVSISGTYWVRVTNTAGCVGQDTIQVTINAIPVVQLGNDTSICTGASVLFDAGNAGSSYLWNNNSTGRTLTASAGGLYSVKVTNNNGCNGSDTIKLSLRPKPVISFAAVDTIYANDAAISLSATPAGGQFSGAGVANGIFDPAVAGAGVHLLQYSFTDVYGCNAVATETVVVKSAFNGVNIYPNPNRGSFTIVLPNHLRNTTMEVVTASGIIVVKKTISANQENVRLSLPAGIYYLKLNNTGFSETKRIIIW